MNNASNTVLVAGATGQLSMAICRLLTKKGVRVKGLVRSTSAKEKVAALQQMGVQTVEGDLKDSQSLRHALQGVTGVISTVTAIVSRQEGDTLQTVDNEGQQHLIEAAASAGVQHFIFVSVHPFTHDFPLQTAKRNAEKKLKESGMKYTILQPTVFIEIWLSPIMGFDVAEAKVTIYGEGNNRFHWISMYDVAAYAVAALGNEKAANKTYELGGPQALSPLEVVQIFEKVLGKKMEINFVPQSALEAQLQSAPDDLSKSFAGLMLGYTKGYTINDAPAREMFHLPLRSVQDYAQQVTAAQSVAT